MFPVIRRVVPVPLPPPPTVAVHFVPVPIVVVDLPVIVRKVWARNLTQEFALIQQSLSLFPFVSMDTEFPGNVFNSSFNSDPASFYSTLKKNVDALKLIQLGLTISDARGNLPNFGTRFQYVWEFNFRDFDPDSDLQNPESISLLKQQGINFSENREFGIDSRDFALLFKNSEIGRRSREGRLTWITFHGPYDFGYLIKILMDGEDLPEDLEVFTAVMRQVFGDPVYDLKKMIGQFGLRGGLEKVAESLNVKRSAGRSHQAGSDSLLTMNTFVALINKCTDLQRINLLNNFAHNVYGLS